MNRIEHSKRVREKMGIAPVSQNAQDPELQKILDYFLFGEVWQQGGLEDAERELITIAVLAALGTPDQCRAHVACALSVGATSTQIKEAIYQCAPYIGFPRTLVAAAQANQVFEQRGISLPHPAQAAVTEENRLEKGLEAQMAIFGEETISKMRAAAPEDLRHIQDYLSAYCFGDIASRGGLDARMREMITLSVLCALGGCEAQVRSHIQGNLNMGNSRETIISVLTQCLPYIGFPRTLNAISCLNEIAPPQK